MNLYYAGAEQPIYLRKLIDLGVSHVAISFHEWQRRFSDDLLIKHVPADIDVCITAGVAKKNIDFVEFSRDYVSFCENNAGGRTVIYDMDAVNCPPDLRIATRSELGLLPNSVLFPAGSESVDQLAVANERIGLNARQAKSLLVSSSLRRIQATLYGSNITDAEVLRQGRFVASTTMAWLSGRRYGELWVYARGKLRHYTAENLERAVRAHRAEIEALGVDASACAANDREALTACAVRSLQKMTELLSKRRRDVADTQASEVIPSLPPRDTTEPDKQTGFLPVSRTADRPTELLPTIHLKQQGTDVIVGSSLANIRQCDSCYVSSVCGKYEPGSSCAYNLPIEIRTADQLEASVTTLLEMQFERTAFHLMAEKLEGGPPSKAAGQEIDRYLNMLEKMKSLKTPVSSAPLGAISRIFGDPNKLSQKEVTDVEPEDEEDAYREDLEEVPGAPGDDLEGTAGT